MWISWSRPIQHFSKQEHSSAGENIKGCRYSRVSKHATILSTVVVVEKEILAHISYSDSYKTCAIEKLIKNNFPKKHKA